MSIIFGSARIDERGKLTGGKVGDSKQSGSGNDYKGEVSMQKGYVHSKGWVILRPKTDDLANRLAYAMQIACNNKHLGYDQSNRLGVMTYGIDSTKDTECDCSSLVRACLKYCGINVNNFTTSNAATTIVNSGYFTKVAFTSLSAVQTGDILCTKTKGHIVICIAGVARGAAVPTKPMVASPTIKKGVQGIHVTYLQQDLNYLYAIGFIKLKAELIEDGDCGTNTVNAIKAFQENVGFKGKDVDGIYGPASYNKMKALLG
jgi:hypothetical protein